MKDIIISPSILSANFANLSQEVENVKLAGAKWLHIDVMDGHFVPNITIGVPVVKSLRKATDLVLDTHLMIENPVKYVEAFAKAGSDILTFHAEACKDDSEIRETIKAIKSCGIKAGLSIKPKTEPEKIFQFLEEVDMLLVMTVEPGFGGQEFMYDCSLKIPKIKERTGDDFIIQVDGGVNNKTAKICTSLGANSLVSGSYIFGSSDYKAAIQSLL